MNYLIVTLLATIVISKGTEGGKLNKDFFKDSNSGPNSRGVLAAPRTTVDNVAEASNQGWSLAKSYLPAIHGAQGYQGPTILSDGTIAETAEVAAARAAHLAALEAARASDPDMGRDDGEYDPQKYGDHLYGIVSHSEDLLQSILSYQALAQGGGVPAPVYGAPGAGMQSLYKTMSDASAGGSMYGAPASGVGRSPAPVYGAPVTRSGGKGGTGVGARGASPAPVYGAPVTRSGSEGGTGVEVRGASPAPVYGAAATGSGGEGGTGVEARGAPPAPVYGAPVTRSGSEGGTGVGVRGAPPAPVYGSSGPVFNMPYSGPLAMLQLLASGYLADTPEVVAARNIHLKALQDAQAAAELWRTKQASSSSQAHPWG